MTNRIFAALARWRAARRPAFPNPETLVLPPPDDLPRSVNLSGAINLRDAGGYRTQDGRQVRRGLVYRAGALANLTVEDVQQVAVLGLRLVCDLRSAEEQAAEPDRLPDSAIEVLHLPILARESTARRLYAMLFSPAQMAQAMPRVYAGILDNNAAEYATWIGRLADPANLPTLVHCTAGKDRTGIAVALLLQLLGVPDDVIVADYSQSNRYHQTFLRYGDLAIERVRKLGVTVEDVRPLLIAHPNTLRATLAYLRQEYGSARDYLIQQGGLSAATLERVRANLLEA